MTTKETKAIKARKTTLNKKSNEELINIILRKDAVERNKNSKISELSKITEDQEAIITAKNSIISEYENTIRRRDNQITNLYTKLDAITINKNLYRIGFYFFIIVTIIELLILVF